MPYTYTYTFNQIQADLDYIKNLNNTINMPSISFDISLSISLNTSINIQNICTFLVPDNKIIAINRYKFINCISICGLEKIKIKVYSNGTIRLVGKPNIQKLNEFLNYVLDKLKDTRFVSDVNACNIHDPTFGVIYNFHYMLNSDACVQTMYDVLSSHDVLSTNIKYCAKYHHTMLSFRCAMLYVCIFKKHVTITQVNPKTLKNLNNVYNFIANLTEHHTITEININIKDNNDVNDNNDMIGDNYEDNDIHSNIGVSGIKLEI